MNNAYMTLVLGGETKCPCGCEHVFEVKTPKYQGVRDWKKLTGKKANDTHKLIINAFLENPEVSLTINDIVMKTRKILYFSKGRASDLDKADLSRPRSELLSWKIIELTGSYKGGAPYYRLTNRRKAEELLYGGVF